MPRNTIRICLVLALCGPASAADLKTTRVALFSSGVGYFENEALVEGDGSAELKFRADQINDILKSLVLRDLDGGTIAAVQYPSRDPVDKALRSFAVDITGKPTLAKLLDQLRGVAVEVQAATPVRGVIVSVEKRTTKTELGVIERDVLTILTGDGLRSFILADVAGVRITDPKIESELSKALATLADSHDAEKKTVVLNFAGQGKRRVLASYLLETPIWKTSYRLVLSKERKPYLQGWAIVENATEQDWESVRLSLISGRPISFIMDLYQPLYLQRPVEELELYRSLRPPTYEGAIPPPAAPAAAKALDMRARRGRQEGGLGGFAGGGGGIFGGAEEMEKNAALGLRLDDAGVQSVARAAEAGELFEYAIDTPVSLKRQQSAMLPIVTADVEGEKLSIYNPATHPKHPLNGLKLKNTTSLYLMQGPVTVFDANLYAGDAKLPDMSQNEERLIAYALDLASEVSVKHASVPAEELRLRIAKGTLYHARKFVDERLYTVANKAETPKTVIVEQPAPGDWTLVAPEKPDEQTAGMVRFRVAVGPKGSQALKVRFEQQREEGVALTNINSDMIAFYLRSRVITEAIKQALSRIVELRAALDATSRQIADMTREIDEMTAEQVRIRENMKTLSQTSDVYKRYERKFDTQETRIEQLREQIAEKRKAEAQQRQALEQYILSLEIS